MILTFNLGWMLVCMLVNIYGARYLDIINKVCLYWTSGSVVIIMVTLLAMADTKRSADYVFAHYDASASGWPAGWAFFVGLLQAAYTLTGYGMVGRVPGPRSESESMLKNTTGCIHVRGGPKSPKGSTQGDGAVSSCSRYYRCSLPGADPFCSP